MTETLALLPGWGFAPAVLQPLRQSLQVLLPDADIRLIALPETSAADSWLDWLDETIPAHAWLIGWSLGSVLATELAVLRRPTCRGLIGLAGTPCFVERPDWPCAMERTQFQAFRAACRDDPSSIRKRFALLCAQGDENARSLGRSLQQVMPALRSDTLLAGLDWLNRDIRPTLEQVACPCLYLFATRDRLVPVEAAVRLAESFALCTVGLHGGGHAACVAKADTVAQSIARFIGAYRHAD